MLKWLDCLCAAPGLFVFSFPEAHACYFFPVYFAAMHLFGLNWQLQELDSQPAFENGDGKTGATQSSIVTSLTADGEGLKH